MPGRIDEIMNMLAGAGGNVGRGIQWGPNGQQQGGGGYGIPGFGDRELIRGMWDPLPEARREGRKYGEIYDRENQPTFRNYAMELGLGGWGSDPAALQAARQGYDAYDLGRANVMNTQDQTDAGYWGTMYGYKNQGDMARRQRELEMAMEELRQWGETMRQAMEQGKGY